MNSVNRAQLSWLQLLGDSIILHKGTTIFYIAVDSCTLPTNKILLQGIYKVDLQMKVNLKSATNPLNILLACTCPLLLNYQIN